MLETLTLGVLILNGIAVGTGLGIIYSRRKLNLDLQEKLKKFDEIAEAASNSSQSIARKVAELQDNVVALNMRASK